MTQDGYTGIFPLEAFVLSAIISRKRYCLMSRTCIVASGAVVTLTALLLGIATPAAHAQFIVPASYTSTPGQGQAEGGSLNYFDDGGVQLTDTILGVNDWQANLGNG